MHNKSKLYSSASEFFSLNGNATMRLTPTAAIDVCRIATKKGILVLGVDGGVYKEPIFEAKINCSWSAKFKSPFTSEQLNNNNALAIEDIEADRNCCNAFILTI